MPPPPVAQQTKPEPPAKPVEEAPPSAPVIKEIPKAAAGHIGIAAIWQVATRASRNADIDLYVSPRPGAAEVFWHNQRAEGATYFRDIRSANAERTSESWQASWEYVEVSHADISKVSLWLNVYQATGPIAGVVRMQYEGRIVDKPFRFDVTRGNKGTDNKIEARRLSPYWQEIRLEEMFPATPAEQRARLK